MNLKNIFISKNCTHHIFNNRPLYDRRFDKVLKYHDPGLAPVAKAGKAWHITTDGIDAYSKRFYKTFGFYEGYAAVLDKAGAYHIVSNGKNLYDKRYEWTGNFQEGRCCVRKKNGEYIHIKEDGSELGLENWNYAGDFKDSIAVVQSNTGLSTHIDRNGIIIHDRWFYDLDVFHKGFARAKDYKGWVHINTKGEPTYPERYAMIEPFYNGQARVETFSSALRVIDENGYVVQELRPEKDRFHELSSDLVGFWKTHTIANAVELNILEYLPSSAESIAKQLSLSSDKLKRLLRALWELDLCCPHDDLWDLTKKGKYLQRNSPYSLSEAATEYLHRLEPKWNNFKDTIKNEDWYPEKNIFHEVIEHRDEATHHNMLSSYAKYDYENIVALLPIEKGKTIIDIGGSTGVLANMIHSLHKNCEITVLDILDFSRKRENGITYKTADFFKSWDISADIIIMSRILHDWNDEHTLMILRNANKHLNENGKIIIVEMILEEEHPAGSLCDLHLLNVTGGKERLLKEFDSLLGNSGFTISEVINTSGFLSIIVATLNE